MKKPDTFKVLEWGAQIVIMAAIGYGSYKVLEYRVSQNEKEIISIRATAYVTKEDYKDDKKAIWEAIRRR